MKREEQVEARLSKKKEYIYTVKKEDVSNGVQETGDASRSRSLLRFALEDRPFFFMSRFVFIFFSRHYGITTLLLAPCYLCPPGRFFFFFLLFTTSSWQRKLASGPKARKNDAKG